MAVFYAIQDIQGELLGVTRQFKGQDSLGGLYINVDDLTEKNCSPLVLTAVQWLKTGRLDLSDVNEL